tara:strand:- start:322 stop:633 length:312 start_codon:yes stop_codon:yes gene_type:complete
MTDRSIRDIVLSIESKMVKGSSSSKGKSYPQRFPKPLTKEQRDIAEIAYDSIKKPFTITEFTRCCRELGETEGVSFDSNGATNRTLRYFLCEQAGMIPTWRKQ